MATRAQRDRTLKSLFAAADSGALRRISARQAKSIDPRTLELAEGHFAASIRGNLSHAARWSVAIAELARTIDTDHARTRSLRTRGVLHHAQGKSSEALRDLESARDGLKRAGDWLGVGDIDRVLVDLHVAAGEVGLASRAYDRGKQAYLRSGAATPRHWGSLEMNRGNLFHLKDDYRRALQAYDLAAKHFKKDGSAVRLGNVSFNRANILALQDRIAASRMAYASARSAFLRAKLAAAVTKVDRGLAELDRWDGKLDDCLERLDEIRSVREEQQDRLGLAHVDLERGRVLVALNRNDEAQRAAERARREFVDVGQPLRAADCDAVLGELEIERERPESGIERLRNSIEAYRQRGNSLAAARLRLIQAAATLRADSGSKSRAAAARLARLALKAYSEGRIASGRGRAHAVLALAGESGRASAAVERNAKASLRIARKLGDSRTEFEMQLLLGREHERRDRTETAYRRFVAAEQCVERMRHGVHTEASKLAFAKDKSEVYERLISNRLQRGDAAALRQALTFSERGKARALIDALGRLKGRAHSPDTKRTARILERLRKLESELHRAEQRLEESGGPKGYRAGLPATVRKLNESRLKVLDRLRRIDTERALLLGAAPPEPWSFIEKLAPEETVLSYTRTGDQFHLFVVDAGRVRAFSNIASVREVRSVLDRLRFQFGKGIYGDDHFQQFGELYERVVRGHLQALQPLLLGPVWDELQGRRVQIVPHEILHGLPFHALECDGEALIDRCEVSYAPSIATLAHLTGQAAPGNATAVILGVSDRSAPAIDDEVAIVQKHLTQATTLQGRDATADAIRHMRGATSILHIACHAAVQRKDPWASALRLGDAWVRLADLYEMPRTGDVVILSGCATGIGTVYSGDEWVGLVRGFFRAGARTVMASLWEVHDRSAVKLMEHFYDSFVTGLSISTSLTQAQRQARLDGVPVLHWAAFMAVGNPSPTLRLEEVA